VGLARRDVAAIFPSFFFTKSTPSYSENQLDLEDVAEVCAVIPSNLSLLSTAT
jgi:hypothetical protein